MEPKEFDNFIGGLYNTYILIEDRMNEIGFSSINEYANYIVIDGSINFGNIDASIEGWSEEIFDDIRDNLPEIGNSVVDSMGNIEWETAIMGTPYGTMLHTINKFLRKTKIEERYN